MNLQRLSSLLPLLILVFISGCATTPEVGAGTFKLSGKTRYLEKSLSSGEVVLMRAEAGGPVFKSAIRQDGSFDIDLPRSILPDGMELRTPFREKTFRFLDQ